ncbi:hypothetical protein D8S78_20060 [Natrialba swarupiae]|nr:hypothetical protein [Natrialba swarupiae]
MGDADAVSEAFSAADHVTSVDLEQPRIIPNAVEPRAAAADYDPDSDDLTVWMTSQNPHLHRMLMSTATLGHPSTSFESSPGGRWRVRKQNLSLPRRSDHRLVCQTTRSSGHVAGDPPGRVHHRLSRPRSRHRSPTGRRY